MAVHNIDKIQHIVLIVTVLSIITLPSISEGLWLFQQNNEQSDPQQATQQTKTDLTQQQVYTATQDSAGNTKTAIAPQTSGYFGSNLGSYGTKLLSIAGIQPASIASLLNTVGDTGFRYFNIQDQCRNRAACDLGFMLFKKLSFVHNWLIRTSVRTLTDMNNIYTQSWMEGMLGRNCTSVYASCRESPLEGLMNLAMLQQLAMSSGVVNQAQVVQSATPVS